MRADRDAVADGVAGQIRHRVVGVEHFAQIKLLGVALQQPFTLDQPLDPAGDIVGQLRQLGRRGPAHPLEARPSAVLAHQVNPIQKQHMEVDVEVQRRAEALDQRDRARAGRLLRKAGLADQVGMSAWVSTFVLSTIVLRLSAQ